MDDNYSMIEKITRFNKQNFWIYILIQTIFIIFIFFYIQEMAKKNYQLENENKHLKSTVTYVSNSGNVITAYNKLIDPDGEKIKNILMNITEKYLVRSKIDLTNDSSIKYEKIEDIYNKDKLYKEFIDNYFDINNKLKKNNYSKKNIDSLNNHIKDLLVILNSKDRRFPDIVFSKRSSILEWDVSKDDDVISAKINTIIGVKFFSVDGTRSRKRIINKVTTFTFKIGENKDIDDQINGLYLRIIDYTTQIMDRKRS